MSEQILELHDLYVTAADTVTALKAHQLAFDSSGNLAFASLIAPANAVKMWRGGLATGMRCKYRSEQVTVPKNARDTYSFRQAGLGRGYVHCVTRCRTGKAIVLLNEDEWLPEMMRVSTVPIAPEFAPYLRKRIVGDHGDGIPITSINCDVQVYRVNDKNLERYLVEGGTGGEIPLPECEMDMGELEGLPDYIRAYAQRMVDSAGSGLQPLLHPDREQVHMPPLGRQPFTPQAWLIEGARRAMVKA